MKTALLAAAAAALLLPASAGAAAPAHDIVVAQRDHHDWNRRDRNWDHDRRNPNAWRDSHPHAIAGHPHWSRGDRLYRQYWGPNYYVTDWRTHHLRRPPHGYRWVEVDGDYLLVAITTGIILDVMLHQMHENRYDHDRYR